MIWKKRWKKRKRGQKKGTDLFSPETKKGDRFILKKINRPPFPSFPWPTFPCPLFPFPFSSAPFSSKHDYRKNGIQKNHPTETSQMNLKAIACSDQTMKKKKPQPKKKT